jgi:hypothetical protein
VLSQVYRTNTRTGQIERSEGSSMVISSPLVIQKVESEMTKTEKQVVDILVACGVATGEHTGIHAVDKAMNWSTAVSKKFIAELRERGLVNWQPIPSDKVQYDPKGQWKIPED